MAVVDAASFLIGTRNDGVFYAHSGSVEPCETHCGLPDNHVEAMTVVNRHAYIGTPTGTADFDLDASPFIPARTLGLGLFGHTLEADASTLMIGTLDQGIRQIALEPHAHLRRASIRADLPEPASTQRIDAFIAAPDTLFAIADGNLVRRPEGNKGASWTEALSPAASGLTDRNVSALAFAPDGSLYVGFFDHGLDILSRTESSVRHVENDHLFCINRLVLDPKRNTVAAATANGLVLFDAEGSPRQTLTRHDGLISDHVTDIAFAGDTTVLATPAGITFLSSTGTESLYAFQGLVNNHVYALAADGQELAAGTLGGLSLLRGTGVQRSFTAANSTLRHNWITAVLPMKGGGYLVGTYGAGLERMDRDGQFTAIELAGGARTISSSTLMPSSRQQRTSTPEPLATACSSIPLKRTAGRGLQRDFLHST